MENFEQKRMEYYEKIKQHPEIVNEIISKNRYDKTMLLSPETETELQLDNNMIDLMVIMNLIDKDIEDSNVDDADVNIAVYETAKFYIKLITAVKNEDNAMIEEIMHTYFNLEKPKTFAKLVYNIKVAMGSKIDFCANIILYEIYDFAGCYDLQSLLQFFEYMKEVGKMTVSTIESRMNELNDVSNIKYFDPLIQELNAIREAGVKNIHLSPKQKKK